MALHQAWCRNFPICSGRSLQTCSICLMLGIWSARSRQGNKGTVEERIVRIGFGAFFIVIIYGIIYPQTLFLGRCHAVGAPTART